MNQRHRSALHPPPRHRHLGGRWCLALLCALLALGVGCGKESKKKPKRAKTPPLGSKLPKAWRALDMGMSPGAAREATGLPADGSALTAEQRDAFLTHLAPDPDTRAKLAKCLPDDLTLHLTLDDKDGLRALRLSTKHACPADKTQDLYFKRVESLYGRRMAMMASVEPGQAAGMEWDERRGVGVQIMLTDGSFRFEVGDLSDR